MKPNLPFPWYTSDPYDGPMGCFEDYMGCDSGINCESKLQPEEETYFREPTLSDFRCTEP